MDFYFKQITGKSSVSSAFKKNPLKNSIINRKLISQLCHFWQNICILICILWFERCQCQRISDKPNATGIKLIK